MSGCSRARAAVRRARRIPHGTPVRRAAARSAACGTGTARRRAAYSASPHRVREAQRLAALFGEHLQRSPLPEPVRACELRAAALVPHLPGSRSLWQAGEHGGDAGDETCGLIERLRARFGAGTVHGLAVRDEHRPESAWALTAPPRGRRAARRRHAAPPGGGGAASLVAPAGAAAARGAGRAGRSGTGRCAW